MGKALEKKSSITFLLSLWIQNFLLWGDDNDLHSEECCFVWGLYKKHHASFPVIMLLRELSLSAISMRALEMFIYIPFRFFFYMSTFKVTNVDKHGARSTHHEEYCANFPQKFHSLMQFGPHIFFHHFSHSLTHARHLFHLTPLMGDHYTDHCQHSHVHHRSVYASHKPAIFSFLCHHMLAATWLMSPLVISAAKHKIWYSYVVPLQPYSTAMWPHTY
jgi:hypothetical protein